MNIVFLYAGEIIPERGGVQRVTQVLSDYLELKGINVYYLSLPNKDTTSLSSKRQYFLPCVTDFDKNKSFYINFLETKNISVVVNQSGISPEISNLAYEASKINVKVISVIHNSILTGIKNFSSLYKTKAEKLKLGWLLPIADIKILNNFLQFLYKLKYKTHYNHLCFKSDKVILLSDQFREELNYITGKSSYKNILSIPNPVAFTPEIVDLNKKKNELLFVGRIDTLHKRVDLLLEIWNRLYENFPDWKLKIVGGGSEMERVVGLSKNLRLQRIFFEGFQNPIPYYRNASIFCMTSSSESFGMVLLEAMQFGLVPFAFNSYPSVTDIIDNEENGILIQPFDCSKYVNELALIMLDKTRRERIAKMAQEKATNFSIEKVGKIWLNIFEEFDFEK